MQKSTQTQKRLIKFTVEGVPPKKHGAKSMWSNYIEVKRIILLRKEASKAMEKASINECFNSLIALELTIYVPESKLLSVGDLDNFVTGICDGLQKADRRATLHQKFQDVDPKIHPSSDLLISDDANIVSITAKKLPLMDKKTGYYDVIIKEV